MLHSNLYAFDWIRKAKSQLRGYLGNVLEKRRSRISEFYDRFLADDDGDFEEIYSDVMMASSLEVFNLLAVLFER